VIEPNPRVSPEDIGSRLRAVRELTGTSAREVAKAAGLSGRELRAAERGAKRLTADELHALAGSLGVDPEVLVGVGFEGELFRPGTTEDRIDQVIGHDPDGWDALPASVEDLPAALPVNLPDPERRQALSTRARIEQSWHEVREEMSDALSNCARLLSAGSGDDVRVVLDSLERDLQALKSRRSFLRALSQHERAVLRARGAGTDVTTRSLAQ
jgi:transcriptional regulator with XRE-family HTH domain